MIYNSNYNTYIIAEIGINHEGSYERCIEMVYAAKETKVNAIKLQTIDADNNYAKNTESYQLFKKSSLTKKETKSIFELAKSLKLDCLTTVGDIETVKWIKKLKPSAWKISSSLFTHLPLIKYICKENQHIYLSTGLANDDEIKNIISKMKNMKKNNFTIFHCISKYPLKENECSLEKISFLKNEYNVNVGYSDHTAGTYSSCLAVSLGAKVIEKHFTFDKKRKGYDHKISLDYIGMRNLVRRIRLTEEMIKLNKSKELTIERNRKKYLRVIVAKKPIKIGEDFSDKNISIKRVRDNSNGVTPLNYKKIIGRSSQKKYSRDDKILNIEIKDD